MPTYEYECRECGHTFERFQGINEDPIRKCPECAGGVRRLISTGGGLVFKGPGFYATDYRSRSTGPSEGADKKDVAEDRQGSSVTDKGDKDGSD